MKIGNMKTSHNRTLNASPPSAARATQNPVGLKPFVGFALPHFFAPEKMLRIFPYRAQKNVVYRRNVKRKFGKNIG